MTLRIIAGRLVSSATTIGSTAAPIPTTAATGRISIGITNKGAETLYIGGSDVTVVNGTPIEPSEKYPMDLAEKALVYGITASGNVDVRSLEGV
ncbi:hypothetical protein LCGC14_2955960 [marine sediment metagenome]|uniref:Uncharacterized protein n=1 Tax=marine sediment metagenome TaxID=412755 RepID=A0A0F8XDF9_9ZZZZ